MPTKKPTQLQLYKRLYAECGDLVERLLEQNRKLDDANIDLFRRLKDLDGKNAELHRDYIGLLDENRRLHDDLIRVTKDTLFEFILEKSAEVRARDKAS